MASMVGTSFNSDWWISFTFCFSGSTSIMPDFDSLRVAVLLEVEVVDLSVEVVEAVVLSPHLWAKADQLPRSAFHQQANDL